MARASLRDALEQIKFKSNPVVAYTSLLQKCKDLANGKLVHGHILDHGFGSNAFLSDQLIQMYANCGSLGDAELVFKKLQRKNMFSYNFMVGAYARYGYHREALELLQLMEADGLRPDAHTFSRLVSAFSSPGVLAEAKAVHDMIMQQKAQVNDIVENAIVNMYAKCGSLEDARKVFNNMAYRNVVSWNCLITAYTQRGDFGEAVGLYEAMDVQPNVTTLACVLGTCAGLADLEKGKKVHQKALASGLVSAVKVQNALVSMYAKCGCLDTAEKLFNQMQVKDVVSWNTMMAAYAQNGLQEQALKLFRTMDQEGTVPDSVTFLTVVSACQRLLDCRAMHQRVVASGYYVHGNVQNAVVAMYAKSGRLGEAKAIFYGIQQRHLGSWTVMIAAYVQHGRSRQALDLYGEMKAQGIDPDEIAFASLLRACSSDLGAGREIHEHIVATGCDKYRVIKNALVSMYADCGCIDDAKLVFESMEDRDYISWTAMVTAYAQLGYLEEALQTFEEMDEAGVAASPVTFAVALGACCGPGYLERGRRIHEKVVNRGFETTLVVQNSLVNMYGKCGSLCSARLVFQAMQAKDVISWTAMVAAYTQNGRQEEGLDIFNDMVLEGVLPSSVTFTVVLVACSQAGLVEAGRRHFDSMAADYGLRATVEHVGCLIDLLGRAGWLKEAEDVVKRCLQQDDIAWRALLSACKIHCNTKLAGQAAEQVAELVPGDIAPYLLLSNIHAELSSSKGGELDSG